MSIRIQEITDAESFKTHIMDSTLWNMANLAHMLGYGWCLGNRGVNVGEDFERNGNTWQASTKLFYSDNNCYGEKCDQRLSLTFGDWSLAVKEVKYGQSVIDDLQPESIESGTIQNNDASPVTETFEISRTIQQTITHTSTSSWSNSHEAGLSINFNLPFGLGGLSASYKFRYETSSSTTDEQSTQNSKTFTKITSKTVQPFSGAKYNVILGKSRTTIPYTAVIIAKFSTEFIGFMRHGGGYGSKTTNYHYQYQGTKNTPTIKHRFGSTSVPFYTALRREVESQSRPWLWTEMFKNYPTARNVINSLTDEAQYEFTLHGTLAQVAGTKIDVNWETVNITQQDKLKPIFREIPISNKTYLAVPGPDDRPAVVQYPAVSPVKTEIFQFEVIPVIMNSTDSGGIRVVGQNLFVFSFIFYSFFNVFFF
ncbi:hypothetical protein Btru_058743 [Bulinus truncatus]|nr:hypothetical protein Btru_058743 [Bulinus truncatus]